MTVLLKSEQVVAISRAFYSAGRGWPDPYAVRLRRRLDSTGQPYDVERSMTALAIGRAIHAAGQIVMPDPNAPKVYRPRGCSDCPFWNQHSRHGTETYCQLTGDMLGDRDRTRRTPGSRPGNCPLHERAVLVTMEER